MERKSRARSESLAFVAIVAAALVLLNILAIKFFVRWDLTKRQLFTLSDGTHRIVGGLHDQLTVTVYFTPNQPAPASDDERFLRDQLDEYRVLGHGHLVVHYVTPDNDTRRHDADAAGCTKQALQAVDTRQEQATIQEVYRCVAFEYLGRREKIEFLPPGVQGLEYEITSIIRNLAAPEAERERTIGFLSGHGETTPDEGMQYLPEQLRNERLNYHTRTVNLNNGDADVPTDIKGLIIDNPNRQITDRELRKLDAYLMHGGSIALFTSGLNFASADPVSATGVTNDNHINDWIDGYGIHFDGNVILDPRSTDGVISRGGRPLGRVRLVTWPDILSPSGTPTAADLRNQGGLDPAFPAVFRLPDFIAPYPCRITINDAARNTAGGTLSVFARTSPNSVLRTSDFDLNVVEIIQQGRQVFENNTNRGPFVIGAALQGRFRSAFAGHPPAAAPGAALPAAGTVPDRAEHDARLLVIGSGELFALESLRTMAQISGGHPSNLNLLFNTFDWLSQDTDLLAVRAKDTSDPAMRADVTDTAKQIFKWGATALLPIAIGVLGVAITSARRGRRKAFRKQFGTR